MLRLLGRHSVPGLDICDGCRPACSRGSHQGSAGRPVGGLREALEGRVCGSEARYMTNTTARGHAEERLHHSDVERSGTSYVMLQTRFLFSRMFPGHFQLIFYSCALYFAHLARLCSCLLLCCSSETAARLLLYIYL